MDLEVSGPLVQVLYSTAWMHFSMICIGSSKSGYCLGFFPVPFRDFFICERDDIRLDPPSSVQRFYGVQYFALLGCP